MTTQCVRNLEQVLVHAGSSLKKVLKVTVFLDDMDDFDEMNKAYEKVSGAYCTCAYNQALRRAQAC
jgi:2-iminobutanoate/2-iminopropanoate deaminase